MLYFTKVKLEYVFVVQMNPYTICNFIMKKPIPKLIKVGFVYVNTINILNRVKYL